MNTIDPTGFAEWRAKQSDGYGRCCFDFAEAWADAMEPRIAAGESVDSIAQGACREVDCRPGFGITGYMYGVAVAILSRHWIHGDALRRWHNIDVQIGTEGEKANTDGTVLNPALIRFGPPAGGGS